MTDGPEVVCCACGGSPLVSLAPPLCAECHPNAKQEAVMTVAEGLLTDLLKLTIDSNIRAGLLQSFIADFGPLSEEAAKEVREILAIRKEPS